LVVYPSKYGKGTIAFEDLWLHGDYDFNDVAFKVIVKLN
jgi:LruC domain-containing protein